jgi:hypothetical protein
MVLMVQQSDLEGQAARRRLFVTHNPQRIITARHTLIIPPLAHDHMRTGHLNKVTTLTLHDTIVFASDILEFLIILIGFYSVSKPRIKAALRRKQASTAQK